MQKIYELKNIIPCIDTAFKEFYDSMLSDVKLSGFFESKEQVTMLIKKQKEHFINTLSMSDKELKESYVKLGEFHYDIRIPYVDFIKGSEMLEESILLHSSQDQLSHEMLNNIFSYFKNMKAFTAKGYLNRMIAEDKKDIDSLCPATDSDEQNNLSMSIAYEKIRWLKNLLDLIEKGGDLEYDSEGLYTNWTKELSQLSEDKKKFLNNLEERIMINTQNLFYFLKNESYLEILPLYNSLLSIYKLTLMLNNVVTVEYANTAIENLKIDTLTGLLRKDVFLELLDKELSYVKREADYGFSIAYLDLDDFKYVNDTFGHYSGDKVIGKLGEIIKKRIRGSDIGFRIGGDEFAIIFKNATKEQAAKVSGSIKDEFSNFEFIFNDETVFHVSASIGVTGYDKDSKVDVNDIIREVDSKLYKAKHTGKDTVTY